MAGMETEPRGTRARSIAATPIRKPRPARRSSAADRSSRDITLIVFCRDPVAGQTKTRLIPRLGAANAAALARAFIDDALRKCRALAPARIVIAASAPGGGVANSPWLRRIARRFGAVLVDQGSGGLGARMAHALEPYRAGAYRHRHAVVAARTARAKRCAAAACAGRHRAKPRRRVLPGRGARPDARNFSRDPMGPRERAQPDACAASPQPDALRAWPSVVRRRSHERRRAAGRASCANENARRHRERARPRRRVAAVAAAVPGDCQSAAAAWTDTRWPLE